jgi:exodeoxyribonuclease-3
MQKIMRIITWNVNGIRAIAQKSFAADLTLLAPDVLCLQETKAQTDQFAEVVEKIPALEGYHWLHDAAEKKGYSGTAILSRMPALSSRVGLGVPELDGEGRMVTWEFETFYLVSVYTPNSSAELKRLPFRQAWDVAFCSYLRDLASRKPVICCGDLNVAHQPIDLARPAANYNKTPGYTQVEIDGMGSLLDSVPLADGWRVRNPDRVGYSWWSFRGGAREQNVGWRLDYFLISPEWLSRIESLEIRSEIGGSDHCPVVLDLQP